MNLNSQFGSADRGVRKQFQAQESGMIDDVRKKNGKFSIKDVSVMEMTPKQQQISDARAATHLIRQSPSQFQQLEIQIQMKKQNESAMTDYEKQRIDRVSLTMDDTELKI